MFTIQPGAWPGLSPDMQAAAAAIYAGHGVDPNKFIVTPTSYYHIVEYATTGQTALNLFNVAPAPFVCNLPIQGTIQNETFFRCDCVRVKPITGMTLAGARAANGAQLAATVNPSVVGEELRTIFESGSLTLTVGDKKIVDGVQDLTKFPAGGGMAFNPAISGTAAAGQAVPFNNGTPDSSNGYWFRPSYGVLPGKPIAGSLNWRAALTVTTAFLIRVELCGLLVRPTNN